MPNHHLKTALSTFGGSIFSGTELKANTKMETDVERVRAAPYLCIFHVFICRPLGLNISRGGWKNDSEAMAVKVENCAVKNLGSRTHSTLKSPETLTDDFNKRAEGNRNIDRGAEDHGKWLPIRLKRLKRGF